MSLELYTKQIDDKYIRQNFEKIEQAWNDLVFTLGDFEFFEFRITGAQEDYKLYHNLKFNPNDVIVTKAIGSAYEFDYTGFNDQYLTISTTGDLYLRMFIGNMRGDEVVGSTAFAGITDDLGNSGGGSGGYTFYKEDFVVDGTFLITGRNVTLAGVPINNSETMHINGLMVADDNYTIAGNILTIDPSLNIEAGDDIFIRFSS